VVPLRKEADRGLHGRCAHFWAAEGVLIFRRPSDGFSSASGEHDACKHKKCKAGDANGVNSKQAAAKSRKDSV
jgi:hypothetical protein